MFKKQEILLQRLALSLYVMLMLKCLKEIHNSFDRSMEEKKTNSLFLLMGVRKMMGKKKH